MSSVTFIAPSPHRKERTIISQNLYFRMYCLCGYGQYWAQFHPKSVQQWVLYGNSPYANKYVALLVPICQKKQKLFERVTHNAVCNLKLTLQMAVGYLSSGANISASTCINWIESSINVFLVLVLSGLVTVPPEGVGASDLEKRYRSNKVFCWVWVLFLLLFFFFPYKSKFWSFQLVSWKHRDGMNFSTQVWWPAGCNLIYSLEITHCPVTGWIHLHNYNIQIISFEKWATIKYIVRFSVSRVWLDPNHLSPCPFLPDVNKKNELNNAQKGLFQCK